MHIYYSFTFLGGHEAGQGGGHTPSREVEGDPKVQDGDDLIPERGVEGQGARPKPGIFVVQTVAAAVVLETLVLSFACYSIGEVSGGGYCWFLISCQAEGVTLFSHF